MPFDRPDLKTLITRCVNDINSRFDDVINALRRKTNSVYGRVLAGLAHGLYGHQEWISRQILPATQDEDYLLRYGTQRGIIRKNEGYAAGNVTATGTDGYPIDADELLQSKSGTEYIVTAQAAISGSSATVAVKAVEAGTAGNLEEGGVLTFVSPVAGVNAETSVAAGGIVGGTDIEDPEDYRSRVKRRDATVITGANQAVYEMWAEEVDAVTRAWVYENTPADGSVTVLFVCDDQGGGTIIPNAAKITEVADYLEEHTDPATGITVGRGVNVTLVVDGPTEEAVDFTITVAPATQAVRDAVEAELSDLLRREGEPGGTIPLSHVGEAISTAGGEESHILTIPSSDIVASAGAIPVMGDITWVA